jgi:hypothetical protein
MTTITNNTKPYSYTPSVNIIRDEGKEVNYILTPNALAVFNLLTNNYQTGIRSFTIVGAYGTGKSAFLLAFQKSLQKDQAYFTIPAMPPEVKGFQFLNIVGNYESLIENFANELRLPDKTEYRITDIINGITAYLKRLQKKQIALVIVIDEFGKFLEYAAKNNPEKELYFIQQLAELANDTSKELCLITTLHQDFNGYSRDLSKSQQNEWDKVRGRLKEITFNEPVEQLLFLASQRMGDLQVKNSGQHFRDLFDVIQKSKAFPLRDYFNEKFARQLLPFDILSAAILTLALQKYGQNERSLFSFIESTDPGSISDINYETNPYFAIPQVYDYLITNYYSFINTKYNPHYTQWAAIRIAIERAEGLLEGNVPNAVKIIKTIGLLNIFGSASIILNNDFLNAYSSFSLGIKQPEKTVKALQNLKIIRFVNFTNRYILFEGTDLDIELAIDHAGNLVERVTNVVQHLNNYFDFPYINAKASFYQTGTPRFFAFRITDTPLIAEPFGEVDGYINLIFSDQVSSEQVREASDNTDQPILFGYYKNTTEIKNLLFEIQKIKKVKETYADDKVAVKELEKILSHQINLLNHLVTGSIYKRNTVDWYYAGEKETFANSKIFNRFLSTVCGLVYPNTPVFRNEMVNKSKLSSQIQVAKRNLMTAVINNWQLKDLGFPENKFPPEKTIYLGLLRESGIHREENGAFILGRPHEENFVFQTLWDCCSEFIASTHNGKRNLQELVDQLLSKPYKLKQGLIDFWLPIFLFIQRDDFAVFHEDNYIPFLSQNNLELIGKNPKDYEIKAFNIQGVKLEIFNSYRTLLNQSHREHPTGPTFIETIRPFFTFYRSLPDYAKNTQRLNKKTIALRSAIALAKYPEDTFFEDFPRALGFTIAELQKDHSRLSSYVTGLENSIKEIRTCYEELIARVEVFICDELVGARCNFKQYQKALQDRLSQVKRHLLLGHQKAFMQRLYSEIDDHKAWLNSICQTCIGKTLETISDEEEVLFYEKLKDIVHELDNLCDISVANIDDDKETAIKFEMTSFVEGLKKNLIRIPKNKKAAMQDLQLLIKSQLTADKQLNIASLAKILGELIDGKN